MGLNCRKGLTNSQSYRNIGDTLSEINFEERFSKICKEGDVECGKKDLKYFLEDIVTHYRNRVSQDFDLDFWNIY